MWPMAAMMFGARHGRGRSDWGGDWGERGGPRGPRGRSRVFGTGELRLVLLHLLGESPRHGYDLIKAIEELTGGAYAPSPGVVYPTLSLLTDEGLVAEQAGEGARKVFALTEAGLAELASRAEDAAKLVDRLKALGEADNRHRSPQVARAMGNLMLALRNRAAHGDFDKATMLEVTAILDEAAQRIERL
jgi:DNA-binding PadR family transcriptional regulator